MPGERSPNRVVKLDLDAQVKLRSRARGGRHIPRRRPGAIRDSPQCDRPIISDDATNHRGKLTQREVLFSPYVVSTSRFASKQNRP